MLQAASKQGSLKNRPTAHPHKETHMPFFTPVKTLPEGTVYFTDLAPVQDFSDWLAEFDVLLDKHQDSLFATVCAPMRLQKSDEQRIADRKTYLAWIKARQPQLGERCIAMLLIEPDPPQLDLMREQSSKLAPSLGVNYIVEADETAALERAEAALKQAFQAA